MQLMGCTIVLNTLSRLTAAVSNDENELSKPAVVGIFYKLYSTFCKIKT